MTFLRDVAGAGRDPNKKKRAGKAPRCAMALFNDERSLHFPMTLSAPDVAEERVSPFFVGDEHYAVGRSGCRLQTDVEGRDGDAVGAVGVHERQFDLLALLGADLLRFEG